MAHPKAEEFSAVHEIFVSFLLLYSTFYPTTKVSINAFSLLCLRSPFVCLSRVVELLSQLHKIDHCFDYRYVRNSRVGIELHAMVALVVAWRDCNR